MTSSNFLTTKISYLHSALRASTHFITIIITIDGFFCQFQINLDIFSWMQDYLLKNWNLFQSFCFTLYPNSKNFSVLLKARTKRNWTFEDFQVSMWSQLYLLTLLRCRAARNSNCRRLRCQKNKKFGAISETWITSY